MPAEALTWHDADARAALAALGVETLDELVDFRGGEAVSSARTRSCRRVDFGERSLFIKTQRVSARRLAPRRWPSYALRPAPLRREATNLRILEELGVRTPRILVEGVRRDGPLAHRAVLGTESVSDSFDLVAWLATGPPRRQVEATLAALEELVARIHARGYVLLGAKYRNVLVPADGGARGLADIVLIDQPDMRRSRSQRLRAKDARHLAFDRARYAAEDPA